MLVDMSLSMGNLPIGEDDRNRGEDNRYRRTLESVILQLETDDRAALGRVSAEPALSPASSDSLALSALVRDVLTVPAIERMGPSPLWDAVISAIDLISRESESQSRDALDRPGDRPAIGLACRTSWIARRPPEFPCGTSSSNTSRRWLRGSRRSGSLLTNGLDRRRDRRFLSGESPRTPGERAAHHAGPARASGAPPALR